MAVLHRAQYSGSSFTRSQGSALYASTNARMEFRMACGAGELQGALAAALDVARRLADLLHVLDRQVQ